MRGRIDNDIGIGLKPGRRLEWSRGIVYVQDGELRGGTEFFYLPKGLAELFVELLES